MVKTIKSLFSSLWLVNKSKNLIKAIKFDV